jgi:hypothetical protein
MGVKRSISLPGHFNLGGEGVGIPGIGAWVCSRKGLDVSEKKQILPLPYFFSTYLFITACVM